MIETYKIVRIRIYSYTTYTHTCSDCTRTLFIM